MQFGRSVATSRHDFTTAFELAPDAQRLFPSDMERQHLKLMDMIAAIVGALDERELFQSIIGDTGRQHARFGVNPSHFVAFGDALIWSLEHQFGPAFTPELREAWIALYNAVRSEMIRAAQDAAFERGATLFLRHPSFFSSSFKLQAWPERSADASEIRPPILGAMTSGYDRPSCPSRRHASMSCLAGILV